jgi:uncharacterized membrane protein required for colicin V production
VEELRTLDAVAGAVLGLALLRGLWIGAVGELLSLAGLGAACYVVRAWRLPAGAWLATHSPIEMTELAAHILAALGLGLGTLLSVALLRRLVRRGVRSAGLGLADRVAGALLGAVEGAIVVGALVFGGILLLGRHDEVLAGTRSLAAFEWAESAVGIEAGAARPETQPPAARGAS